MFGGSPYLLSTLHKATGIDTLRDESYFSDLDSINASHEVAKWLKSDKVKSLLKENIKYKKDVEDLFD